jgi:hypothetical protein
MDRPWGGAESVVVGPEWKRSDLLVFGKGRSTTDGEPVGPFEPRLHPEDQSRMLRFAV